RLTTDPSRDVQPAFSPDGRYVVFARAGVLILVPSLGGAERMLGKGAMPDYSPDGKTVAAASQESANASVGIFLFSVETGQIQRITSPPGTMSDYLAHFSPDGKTIAFVRSLSAQSVEVDTVPVAGGS